MATRLTQSARDWVRSQVRREQKLAARVLATEARLSAEIHNRDAILTAHDRVIDERRAEVDDALVAYIDDAVVGLERAAIILGRSRSELNRIVRERRLARSSERRAGALHGDGE